MTFQALVTRSHYWDHAAPILAHIPGSERVTRPHLLRRDCGPILVASGEDARLGRGLPYIYLEHGSGQSYGPDRAGYPGGGGHERCVAFLCPSHRVAALWRNRYPDTPAFVVGCPKLDPWHSGMRPAPYERTVVISFHWPCKVDEPWSGTAFGHYAKRMGHVVASFRSQGWVVLGHGHPKAAKRYHEFWHNLGVKWIPHFDEVADLATLYVCDNSSTIMEFASLGRPVIFLSKPQWRDGPGSPGGRFGVWNAAGLEVFDADQLAGVDLDDYVTTDLRRAERADIVRTVYAYTDGCCSERAAKAIMEVLG